MEMPGVPPVCWAATAAPLVGVVADATCLRPGRRRPTRLKVWARTLVIRCVVHLWRVIGRLVSRTCICGRRRRRHVERQKMKVMIQSAHASNTARHRAFEDQLADLNSKSFQRCARRPHVRSDWSVIILDHQSVWSQIQGLKSSSAGSRASHQLRATGVCHWRRVTRGIGLRRVGRAVTCE